MSEPRDWTPDEFTVPKDLQEVPVEVGDIVKVHTGREALWVEVTGFDGPLVMAKWDNHPATVASHPEDRLRFRRVSVLRKYGVSA